MTLLIYLFFSIVLSVFYIIAPATLDAEFISILLLVDFIIIAFFIASNIKAIKKNIFRHSIFFLIGFLVVHFQFLFQFVVDGEVQSPVDVWVNRSAVCTAMVISSFGLLSFFIGFQSFIFLVRNKNTDKRVVSFNWLGNLSPDYPTVLVGLCWTAFLGFIATADKMYLSGYYGSVDPGVAANRFQLLLGLLISANIILLSRTFFQNRRAASFYDYIKHMGVVFNLLLVLYVGLVMYIGDRGPAITIMLIYFSGYVFHVKNKPSPVIVLIVLFVGTFIMASIRMYRATDKELPFSERVSTVFDEKENNNQTSGTSELAGSVRSLHYAVSDVPSEVDYKYGWFQLRQLLVVIPGMGNFLDYLDPTYENKGSSRLITYLDQGQFFTYGLGTTIIADFFVDFGLIGVISGMFIFGYFMSKFEYAAFSYAEIGLVLYVFIMVFMSKTIYFSRSTAMSALQECTWIIMVIAINHYVFSRKTKIRNVRKLK